MTDFCPFTGLPEHIMQGATAAARTGDIFAEVPESDDKREFNRGFAFACAQMLRCYSAEEVIGAACLTLEEVENLGLEDYDLEPFRKFFRRGE